MRVSYSALNTYKNCPLKFKHQELDRIRVPKTIEAVFGTAVHSALKKMFERTPLFPTLDEILDYFGAKWQEAANKEDEKISKAYFEEGVSMLKNFYKKNPPWNFNVVELESHFQVAIEDPKNNEKHILAGIIDRIDKDPASTAYEIIDYKTSKRMPSQDNLDKDLQISIYNLGFLKKWPHLAPKKIKLSLYYLKHGEKIETARNEQDLENTKAEILKIIREIQRLVKNGEEFIPTPSALCEWCGYKKTCPMWKHLYEAETKTQNTESEIKAIVEEYFSLKNRALSSNQRLKQITAQISDFMAQRGLSRVFSEKGYITRILQEKEVFDSKKARQILAEINRLPEVLSRKQSPVFRATKAKKSYNPLQLEAGE